MIKLNPLTLKQIKRFKQIKRGYWSLIILSVMLLLSLFAEALINSKALVVRYQGGYITFPLYLMFTQVRHLVWSLRERQTIDCFN